MAEKRENPRKLTLRTATIVPVFGARVFECAIFNISEGGACILVSDIDEIPDAFELVIDPDLEIRSCKVAWKAQSKIGIVWTDVVSESRKAWQLG